MRLASALAFVTFATTATSRVDASNVYNANTSATITAINTYAGINQILFAISSLPNNPCSSPYLELSASLTDTNRQILLSRLLTAYTTKEIINIGYDSVTCGPNGYVWVARIG
jgi:hypothetical protein